MEFVKGNYHKEESSLYRVATPGLKKIYGLAFPALRPSQADQRLRACKSLSIRLIALDTGQVFLSIRVFVNLIRPRVRDPFRFVLLELRSTISWVGVWS
jgi:hypothetical protein